MNNPSNPGMLILVVEDELLIATSLEIILESHGYRVLGPFATVASAHHGLENAQPGLALLDYRLADSTTEPLLPELRERHIPACVLTGYGRGQLPSAYTDCHLLQKPFRGDQLLQAIEVMQLHEDTDSDAAWRRRN